MRKSTELPRRGYAGIPPFSMSPSIIVKTSRGLMTLPATLDVRLIHHGDPMCRCTGISGQECQAFACKQANLEQIPGIELGSSARKAVALPIELYLQLWAVDGFDISQTNVRDKTTD